MSKGDNENVIFFKNINPKKYDMEAIFTERILSGMKHHEGYKDPSDNTKTTIEFNKIPQYFRDVGTWPSCTNIRCWSCHQYFDTIPIFIPSKVDCDSDGNKRYKVLGNFCSFTCAMLYLDINFRGSDLQWEYNKMLYHIYKVFNGVSIDYIPCSPPPQDMIQYGGNLTSTEYIHKIRSLKNQKKI